MARDLFPAGFVSCWAELDEGMQEALVRSLEAALASPSIPKDIVTTLLNLAEFMEHDEKSLPLDTRYAVVSCCTSLLNSADPYSHIQGWVLFYERASSNLSRDWEALTHWVYLLCKHSTRPHVQSTGFAGFYEAG